MDTDTIIDVLSRCPYPYFRAEDIAGITPVEVGFTAQTRSGSRYELVAGDTAAITVRRDVGAASRVDAPEFSCDLAFVVTTHKGTRHLVGLNEPTPGHLTRAFHTSPVVEESPVAA